MPDLGKTAFNAGNQFGLTALDHGPAAGAVLMQLHGAVGIIDYGRAFQLGFAIGGQLVAFFVGQHIGQQDDARRL